MEVIVPQICGSHLQPIGGSYYQLTFATCPGQWLIGTQHVAWLNFTAAPGMSSTSLTLELDNITGQQPDGTPVANFAPQSGRVVVVGVQPYLELIRVPGSNLSFILYSAVNSTNRVQWTESLATPGVWNLWQQVVMPDLFLELPVAPTNQAEYFRAVTP